VKGEGGGGGGGGILQYFQSKTSLEKAHKKCCNVY